MKVMILEDEQAMAKLLTTLLKIEGFEVLIPENLTDVTAKSIISSEADAVFMDVNLMKHSSIPILKEIRKKNKGRKLQIIMTSGFDLRKECIEAGANEFLLKPYMPDELIKILRSQENKL
jgi:DNA-binding response OmpR family regulator